MLMRDLGIIPAGQAGGASDHASPYVNLSRRGFFGGAGLFVFGVTLVLLWQEYREQLRSLGESKLGQQYQSIVPSVPTSAAVCRSPIRPCSAIGR